LGSPEDVEARFCECFAGPGELGDVLSVLEVTSGIPDRAVVREKVDDVERELGDEETVVHCG
jgi:hypothetical protein